ncbi:hypothetical protein M3Y97_00605100 [Aphelenchoides bicaudatus]|nr:hypothetical protein M3Y97_00605100 [Aphelenchoides bicaudatus]
MHFLKWRNRKKAKNQNGHRAHSPINPISLVGAIAMPHANVLAPAITPNVVEDDESSSEPYAPSQSTTIIAKSQTTTISKRNGDVVCKSKRKTSRVSFQLGPAILPTDLPNKTQSECGTVSSARFPKPSLKSANAQQQLFNKQQPPPIIELETRVIQNEFDAEAYISYVINVNLG